jgi:hypothetical protein
MIEGICAALMTVPSPLAGRGERGRIHKRRALGTAVA